MTWIAAMSTAELEREVSRIRIERLAGNFDTANACRLADLCSAIRDRLRRAAFAAVDAGRRVE